VSITNAFPYLSIKDKASYKDDRHSTSKHDAQAMKYLAYALYPCVIGGRGGRLSVWGGRLGAAVSG
jgi:hypothetical protein